MDIDVKDMTDPKHKTEKMRVPMLLPHELLNFLTEPILATISFCNVEVFLIIGLCICLQRSGVQTYIL